MERFILKVYRGHPGHQYWEEFELQLTPAMNVIEALLNIQRNPINREGKVVEPIVWEDGCLEQVCGSCSMLINSRPRQACTALIAKLLKETGNNIVILAPFTKYPLVRDLIVNRDSMFENLKKVHAWIQVDGTYHPTGPVKMSQKKQEIRYILSTCMTCGCCVEACPQVNEHSQFIGPQIMAQVKLFNSHPVGRLERDKRLRAVMGPGGISECGNAQNCKEVCPKGIPLTDAISDIYRGVTLKMFRDLFSFPDRDE